MAVGGGTGVPVGIATVTVGATAVDVTTRVRVGRCVELAVAVALLVGLTVELTVELNVGERVTVEVTMSVLVGNTVTLGEVVGTMTVATIVSTGMAVGVKGTAVGFLVRTGFGTGTAVFAAMVGKMMRDSGVADAHGWRVPDAALWR